MPDAAMQVVLLSSRNATATEDLTMSKETKGRAKAAPLQPSDESLRLLIERQWADLHHSRVQEWTALGVVTGAHVAMFQLLSLIRAAKTGIPLASLGIISSLLAALFVVFGALVTLRHRQLMRIKLGWIYQAEDQLGLVHKEGNPNGIIPESAMIAKAVDEKVIAFPRRFSTSWLILCIYLLIGALDLFAGVAFALAN